MVSAYEQRPWLALYDETKPKELTPRFETVLALFESACRSVADEVAVTYFDGRLTYRELGELSDALASYLRDRGFAPGDRLALYLQNVPQFVIALLAGWKAGGIVVPLNPMYRGRELTTILGDCRPAAVVSSEQGWHGVLGPIASQVGARIAITTSELDFQTRHDSRLFAGLTRSRAEDADDLLEITRGWAGSRPPDPELTGADIALLIYTSGTSGVPKGATNTHANITFNAESYTLRITLEERTRHFALAPLFHITGLVCQLGAAFALHGQLHLSYRFEPSVVLDALLEHRPHYMIGPSTAYMALMNHPAATAEHFASLDTVYSGGAPLPSAVVENFRQRFGHYLYNGYGLTETSATATSVPRHLEAPVDAESGTISVGVPTFNTILRVVDDDGRDLPVREVGEIVIEGPMVVPAYWNKPEETRAGIRDGRLHTGDVGFMDEQGWFYIVDRKKDMISASGFKVWPREVEDVLYAHPAVREAAVVGVADPYRGETVRAYVSLAAGAVTTAEELIAHCKGQLAAYKYPRAIEIMADLPKTATGKILRRTLRDRANNEEDRT